MRIGHKAGQKPVPALRPTASTVPAATARKIGIVFSSRVLCNHMQQVGAAWARSLANGWRGAMELL